MLLLRHCFVKIKALYSQGYVIKKSLHIDSLEVRLIQQTLNHQWFTIFQICKNHL